MQAALSSIPSTACGIGRWWRGVAGEVVVGVDLDGDAALKTAALHANPFLTAGCSYLR